MRAPTLTLRHRTLVMALVAALGLGLIAPGGTAAAETESLAQRLLAARQWGNRGLGYGERAIRQLAQDIRVAELPAVTRLLDAPDGRVALGAQFALQAHCDNALRAIEQRLGDADVPLRQLHAMQDALAMIGQSQACPSSTQAMLPGTAQHLQQALDNTRQRIAETARQEDARQHHLNEVALKLLTAEGRRDVSLADCLAVAERGVRLSKGALSPEQSRLSCQGLTDTPAPPRP